MHAFRFLAAGAKGLVNRVAWPQPGDDHPGAWAGPEWEGSALGVFAHRIRDLPLWVHDELYRVELRGPIRELPTGLLAAELRLCARIFEWNQSCRKEFERSCIDELRQSAVELALPDERQGLEGLVEVDGEALGEAVRQLLPTCCCEETRLRLEYLADASGAMRWGLTNSVAHIVHVAVTVKGLGMQGRKSERQRQVDWLCLRLGLADVS